MHCEMDWNGFYSKIRELLPRDIAEVAIQRVKDEEECISANANDMFKRERIHDILVVSLDCEGFSTSAYKDVINRCMQALREIETSDDSADWGDITPKPQDLRTVVSTETDDVEMQKALLDSMDEYKKKKRYEDFKRDMEIIDSGREGLIEDVRYHFKIFCNLLTLWKRFGMYTYYEGMAEEEVRQYVSARDRFYSNCEIQEKAKKDSGMPRNK